MNKGKRTCKIMDFAVLADHRVKLKESEKKEHESDVYTIYNWCSWYSHQRINKGTEEFRNKRTTGDHRNYCISEISQNPEKNPGDLR